MIDQFQRNIDYLRISITEECNLRCAYCMPLKWQNQNKREIPDKYLTSREIIRLTGLFETLGIKKIKITGGEPLLRKDVSYIIAGLKSISGIRQVTLTTNGIFLEEKAEALKNAGVHGINVSLDTLDEDFYCKLTGGKGNLNQVLKGIQAARRLQIPLKINAVLLKNEKEHWKNLTELLKEGIPVRFIELMPLGLGRKMEGITGEEALAQLKIMYPDLRETKKALGAGPARYFESAGLKAPVGLIDAVTNKFCTGCNRVRLTSQGILKPCLCYDYGVDLKKLLRQGKTDQEILREIKKAVYENPRGHCFGQSDNITESKMMWQIGG